MNSSTSELSEFLNKLEKRKVTSNMMIWMKAYDTPCDRICCFSPDCGCIKCSGCLNSLTTFPPKVRFQCIECDILPPEEIFNDRPEVCKDCFDNENILHQHKKWLKIDEKGLHSIEIREKGLAVLKTLLHNDLEEIDVEDDSKLCTICYDDFSTTKAVLYPGCNKDKKHGVAIKDKDKGYIDSKNFNHADCLLEWYKISKRDKYIGELNMCDMCKFEKEQMSWNILFKSFFENFKTMKIEEIVKLSNEKLLIDINCSLNNENSDKHQILEIIKEKLFELHQQEWIREIILNSINNII